VRRRGQGRLLDWYSVPKMFQLGKTLDKNK
jgi:hypothetical protein